MSFLNGASSFSSAFVISVAAQAERGEVLKRGQHAQVGGRELDAQQIHFDDRLARAAVVARDRAAELLDERGGLVLGVVGRARVKRESGPRPRRT